MKGKRLPRMSDKEYIEEVVSQANTPKDIVNLLIDFNERGISFGDPYYHELTLAFWDRVYAIKAKMEEEP